MATFNVTTLLAQVDQNYISTAYQALATALTSSGATGVGGLMLTLYVIVWESVSGRAPQRADRPTMRSGSSALS